MPQRYLDLAAAYFVGQFDLQRDMPKQMSESADESRFDALTSQFFEQYDDWYRDYYRRYGKRLDPVIALVSMAFEAFGSAQGHMALCYKNCAISSGTNPHHDAVSRGYHTTDRLGRLVGSDWHVWKNILDNSTRSLQRAREVQPLIPEAFIVTPSAFEGGTRVFSKGSGSTLTGGLPFDGADYMSFWNMIIDRCTAFILDDVRLDMPSLDKVLEEIRLAQRGDKARYDRNAVRTSDWTNSRNSILEMFRGNLVRFGLHPLRPDAKMDMRIYDEETRSLYPATLLACTKPAVQNMLRWVPQGIAAEEAARTVARLFKLHKMRTDPALNAAQIAPLDLDKLDPLIAKPAPEEIEEMDRLIAQVEPFLLEYCPHLIRTAGLEEKYAGAQARHPLKPKDIGERSLKWQRANIPPEKVAALWPFTLPAPYDPAKACPKRAPLGGDYAPPRRLHDLEGSPFDEKWNSRFWDSNPYENLSEMEKDLARFFIGVLETGLLPLDAPDYHGLCFDLKRGDSAMHEAVANGVRDVALLPGALGKDFAGKVRDRNLDDAWMQLERLRVTKENAPSVAFGAPVVSNINAAVNRLWRKLAGPGQPPSSDFRLALAMKMMDRNYTKVTFQDGWETSEDNARLMVRATMIELGKVARPFEGRREIEPLDGAGRYISFFDRYDALRRHVERIDNDPQFGRFCADHDARALEDMGMRHITVALARMIEMHDCFIEPLFNEGRFDLHKVGRIVDFKKDMHDIARTKTRAMEMLLNKWVWLWQPEDFEGLRQDYRDGWLKIHGQEARNAGPPVTQDRAIMRREGPL